jgi:hypothetical protein
VPNCYRGAAVRTSPNQSYATLYTLAGTLHTGDIVHTTVSGVDIAPYTSLAGDSTFTILAASVVTAINGAANPRVKAFSGVSAGTYVVYSDGPSAGSAPTMTASVTGAAHTVTAAAGAPALLHARGTFATTPNTPVTSSPGTAAWAAHNVGCGCGAELVVPQGSHTNFPSHVQCCQCGADLETV